MASLRLITIPMSHYCEKARWALDRLGIDYVEERHLQGFHYPRTYWVSGGPNVPVLIDGNAVISDSTAILQHLDRYAAADRELYPTQQHLRAQVEAFEERFDEELGVDSRRWVYFHMLPTPAQALRIAGQGVPLLERALAPLFYPFLARFITRRLGVYADEVAAGLARSQHLIDALDGLLADGRRYLVGDRFTAADLALACMLAPYLMPTGYGIRLPSPEQTPPAMRDTVLAFRASATGRFVLHLFATERGSLVPSAPDFAHAEEH
ncbi:MAG: glutathione S-transferase family protein [Gammaproteobacteria bacterium]